MVEVTALEQSRAIASTALPECPLCGGSDRVPLFEGVRSYRLCQHCGLAVAPRLPDEHALAERAEYWAKKHNLRPDRVELVYQESHQEASYGPIRRLLESRSRKGRLLEIGCAAGGFLDAMRRSGWQVEGIELARASVEFARGRGLEVQCGTIHDLPAERRGVFDAVVALDVIEHLADPVGFLRECAKALRQGGTLLILTPNLEGLSARLLRGQWEAACPDDHLWLFTPRSLGWAFERAGLSVNVLRTWDVNPVPLMRHFRTSKGPAAKLQAPPRDHDERQRRLALTAKIGRSRLLRGLRSAANCALSSLRLGDKLIVVGNLA